MGKIVLCILAMIGVIGVGFFITAGLVWVGCWALGLLGVAVAWSWKLTLAIWLLVLVIKALFGGFRVNVNKD